MKKWIGLIVAMLLIGAIAAYTVVKDGNPTITSVSFPVTMAEGEEVDVWKYQSAYTGNPELEAKADADIERLTGLLGSKDYSDYTLYVSIANQYGLKGDGKNELAYLEKALGVDSTATGLAWHNVGQLMARLGAYQTARMAFEKAASIQPIAQYQEVLAEFNRKYPVTE